MLLTMRSQPSIKVRGGGGIKRYFFGNFVNFTLTKLNFSKIVKDFLKNHQTFVKHMLFYIVFKKRPNREQYLNKGHNLFVA